MTETLMSTDTMDSSDDDGIWVVVEDGALEHKGMTLVADRESGDIVALSTRNCNDEQRRSLMPSLSNYPNLKVVDLHNCRYMRSLHQSIGDLSELNRLILSGCILLQKLPASIGRLDRLVEVSSIWFWFSLCWTEMASYAQLSNSSYCLSQ